MAAGGHDSLVRYRPERPVSKAGISARITGARQPHRLLEFLADASEPARRRLSLAKPTERITNGPFRAVDLKIIALASLQLSLDANDPDDPLWLGNSVRMTLASDDITALIGALEAILP